MMDPLSGAEWLGDLSDAAILTRVDQATFARGCAYAESGMVRSVTTADRGRMLLAEVEGSRARPYQTLITLAAPTPRGRIWTSRCSCPVQVDCKHSVAVLVYARRTYLSQRQRVDSLPAWESALRKLVADRGEPAPDGPGMGLIVDPLPVAANYRIMMGPPRISLRPTRRTKAGGWARNVTWAEVASPRPKSPLHPQHAATLKAIHELHRLTGGRDGYFYTQSEIYLGALGARVWPLLRQAAEAGVEFVAGPNVVGEVALAPEPARIVLDVTRDGSDMVLTTALDTATRLDEVRGITLLGDPPHGLMVTTRDGLVLLGLEQELDEGLAELLLRQRQVRIPGPDTERFVHLYLPRLRDHARVTSRDDSVTIPEQPRPLLRVRVAQPTPTSIELRFDIAYAAASGALLSTDDGLPLPRERQREQRLLEGLDLLDEVPGARARRGTSYAGYWDVAHRLVLQGMPAVHFISSVLPALDSHPDVRVVIDGELTAYEEASEAPVIDIGLSDSADGRTDWFDLQLAVSVGQESVPLELLLRALVAGDEALLLDSGTWFRLDDPALDSLRTLIAEARALVEPGAPLGLSRYHVGLWDDLSELGVTTIDSAAWTDSVERLRSLAETPPPAPPAGLKATLRPYQVDGYSWLNALWQAGLGGILADDMGLGKTVQTLALLEQARAAGEITHPILVVAPTSVLGVWASEAERFAPQLQVTVLSETSKRRGVPVAEAIASADLVVTSYAVARIDGDEFREVTWRGLIIDEAQFVKNHQAKTHHVLRAIQAPFRLAMTGTPLENSLMDLWSLLALVAPGLYPRADRFSEVYRRPIESGESPETLDRLRRRVRPLMLRRTKELVAQDLPEKQEQNLSVELAPAHRRLYDQHLQRERQRVLGLLDDPVGNRIAILAALTRLRQLALDPALIDPTRHTGTVPAKVEALIEHLQELQAEGHRALVFSQFTTFLQLVRGHLTQAGISTEYLDGATRNRAQVIDRFKTGTATAFLISLKAGGVGLTLTEADYVFVLDPWWNPAAEAQAIDRAHRIGQTNRVMVYRLISASTIEGKVVELQRRKRDLFERVIDEGGSMSGQVTADDIRALLDPS
ncbi:SNF2-related protein [Nostocoides sp.]|uniref:DEAD/DEAH box helicase n=1 Tax=Nostocoides sp. TaxID=1917966 RepID=UPI003BAE788A